MAQGPFFFSSPSAEFIVTNQNASFGVGASNTLKWASFGPTSALTLTPGSWRISGWWNFFAIGSVTYAQNKVGWFGAIGTGTTVAPANISSVSGFSVVAGAGFSGSNTFIVPFTSQDNGAGEAPTLRVFTNTTQPVFFGMAPQGTTLSNAGLQFWLTGEKVP
jgi:hypothetical protein